MADADEVKDDDPEPVESTPNPDDDLPVENDSTVQDGQEPSVEDNITPPEAYKTAEGSRGSRNSENESLFQDDNAEEDYLNGSSAYGDKRTSFADEDYRDPHRIITTENMFSKKKKYYTRLKNQMGPCKTHIAYNCNDCLWRFYVDKLADVMKDCPDEKPKCVPKKKKSICGIPDYDSADDDSIDDHECTPLNVFNLGEWRETNPDYFKSKKKEPSDSSLLKWKNLPPGTERDYELEEKIAKWNKERKEAEAKQCENDIVSIDSSEDEVLHELAQMKELYYAKIPFTEIKNKDGPIMIDRCEGPREHLVEGDFIVCEFHSSTAARSIAYVVLHGTLGRPIQELERVHEETWGFDMYQAIVALMVKTQLRMEFAWSPNVDYIYETAWHIFFNVGILNSEKNVRFDDVLIYNYVYSIELEQIDEYKDIVIWPNFWFKFMEKNLTKCVTRHRRELTLTNSFFGQDKEHDVYKSPVHAATKGFEKWFNNLDPKFENCVLKTGRFVCAFWKELTFWYVYNPYRCDDLGFFSADGQACITKHCSKEALCRHLCVLLIRAYSYQSTSKKENSTPRESKLSKSSRRRTKSASPTRLSDNRPKFSVRIFQMIFHSCRIHNTKLYNREPRKEKQTPVEPEPEIPPDLKSIDQLSLDSCGESDESGNENKENPNWICTKKITWIRGPKPNPCDPCNDRKEAQKEKWHHYQILKSHKLYILWGNIHVSDELFSDENRFHQASACYAICIGMIKVNAPEYWTSEMLDAVIVCGDRFYTERKKTPPSYPEDECAPRVDPEDMEWEKRPEDQFNISGFRFEIIALPVISGQLYCRDETSLCSCLEKMFENNCFGIYSCESTRLGIYFNNGAFYIFDAHSYGPPIFESGDGACYLLRATSFTEFLTCLILITGSSECSKFELQPIDLKSIVDLNVDDECGSPRCQNQNICGEDNTPFEPICPRDDDLKKCKMWSKSKECKKKIKKDEKKMERISCCPKSCK